jgi:hypothetical protein
MLVSMVCSQVMLLASCSLQEDACHMPSKYEEATEDFFAYPESRLEAFQQQQTGMCNAAMRPAQLESFPVPHC